MGMVPDEQGIFYILIVGGGPGAGEFTYDASGNLRSANVGQVTTDPVQGITCQQGFSTFNGHGAVINLLSTSVGAFFQYQDLGTSTQGSLILSVASVSGTDPVTSHTYGAGLTGTDPVFGDQLTAVGANIGLAQVAYTRNANIAAAAGGGATQPKLQLDAPEQTTASHLQMWMTGASPDATKVAQLILGAVAGAATLTAQTKALLEVQGTTAAPADPVVEIVAKAAGDLSLGIRVSGDTVNRFQADSNGVFRWSSGSAGVDLDLYRASAGLLQTDNALSVLAQILCGTYLDQTGIVTPAAPAAGHARLFADTAGFLRMLAGLVGDTNVYSLGHVLAKTTATTLINSTTPIAITGLSAHMGIGDYLVRGKVTMVAAASGTIQPFTIRFNTPDTLVVSNMRLTVEAKPVGTGQNTNPGSVTTLNSDPSAVSGSWANNSVWIIDFDGVVTVSTAGTFQVYGRDVTSSASETATAQTYSFLEVHPAI